MDKRELNRRINALKDAYPNELAIIEGAQKIINTRIAVISDANRQALRQFPMQFARRINLGNGEWTTTLHMWADNLVDTLLEIDPMLLTTSNSAGESVLHALVFAATGKFTQMVNYEFIQKMLDKNMGFIELAVPNNPNSKVEGNAWVVKDAMQKTPMDYLVEFANGDPDNEVAADELLQQMLSDFGNSPTVEPAVDNTPTVPVTDEELAAADARNGVGPDGQVDPASVPQAQPGNPADNTPDLTVAQEKQTSEDAGTTSEKEISAAEPVAQAAAQEKRSEKEDVDNPILETILGILRSTH